MSWGVQSRLPLPVASGEAALVLHIFSEGTSERAVVGGVGEHSLTVLQCYRVVCNFDVGMLMLGLPGVCLSTVLSGAVFLLILAARLTIRHYNVFSVALDQTGDNDCHTCIPEAKKIELDWQETSG